MPENNKFHETFGDDASEADASVGHDEVLKRGYLLGGNLEMLEKIGQGGMGEVWLANELDKDGKFVRQVVVKIVPRDVQRASEEMERVQESFHTVEALHHAHICPLYRLDRDEQFGYFITMKYINGKSLSAYVRDYRKRTGEQMPFSILMPILVEIADALDYAHGKGVIHRDVKPQNILSTEKDGAQLIDFGLAATIRSSAMNVSNATAVSGTLIYMSPEQLKGRRQNERTDQYAFAASVYEILSGNPPFQSDDRETLRTCILHEEVEEIDGMPPHVNAALLRALAKDPKHRFESCMDFVQAVKEGVKPSAPPASSPDPFAAVPVAPTMPGPPAVPPVSSGSAEFWKFMREHFVAIIIFVLISPCLLSCMCSMCIPSSYRDGGGSAYSPGGSRVEQERNRQAALEKARKAFGELLVSGKKFVSDWSYNGQFGKIGFVIEEHSPEMHTFKGFVFDVTEPAKKKLMDGKFDVSLQAKYPVVLSCSRIGVPKTEWTNRTQSFFLLDDYNTKFELQLDGNTLAGVADGYDAHRAAMRFTEISDEAYENIMSTFENAEKVRIAKINDAIAPGKNYTCDWNYDGNIGKLGIRIESLDTGAGTFEGYLYNVRAPAEKKRFTGVVNYSRAAGAQYVFRESQIGISRPNYMTNPTGYFFLADGFASTFSLTLEAGELVGTVAQRNSDRFGPDCRFKETN